MTIECFGLCTCHCGKSSSSFDDIRKQETRFGQSLQDICHSNVGWYSDKSLGSDHLIREWESSRKFGLYLLWHKNDYCARHERFHMKALYVGKGIVGTRIIDHWSRKDFSAESLVYWTFTAMENRKAKYYEQLLLDIYDFPFNQNENTGSNYLCSHWSQGEVD